MSSCSAMAMGTLFEHCDRLQRDASALGVLVVGEDGGILATRA